MVGGMEESYAQDGQGRLTRRTHSNGSQEDFVYDGSGFLGTRIVDSGGRAGLWEYERDAVGLVTRQVDPSGVEVRYAYDKNNLLTRWERVIQSDPERTAVTSYYYYYAALHLLSKVADNKDSSGNSLSPATIAMRFMRDAHGNPVAGLHGCAMSTQTLTAVL